MQVEQLEQIQVMNWRSEIVNSVLERGLKPSSQLEGMYLGSGTGKPLNMLEGVLIDGVDDDPMFKMGFKRSRYDLGEALYANELSVLPVVAERPENGPFYLRFYRDPANLGLITARVNSSFLVVILTDNNCPRRLDPVDPEDSLCFIFPSLIWEQYPKLVSHDLLTKVRVTATQVMRRFSGGFPTEIPVPDYESVLRQLSLEHPGMKWVHGVRLPIAEDLKSQKG